MDDLEKLQGAAGSAANSWLMRIVCVGVLLAILAGAFQWASSSGVCATGSRLTQDQVEQQHVRTPPGMVFVPEGSFVMGSDEPDADEEVRPRRVVSLPSFYIDRLEVTNGEYARASPSHRFPAGEEDWPATHVTRDEAESYLRSVGKRLPTGAEWEKAARGTDGRRYPWGETFDPTRAHVGRPHERNTCSRSRLARVGSHPEGASPYGCLDMAGNAWEWVADDYRSDPPRHIIRGGAFGYPERFLRTYAFAIEEAGVT